MDAYHNMDGATQAAIMDSYYDEQERQCEKRKELLAKFMDGGRRYNEEQLFRSVIEGLVRGADPFEIIEKLIDINKNLQDRIREYLLYNNHPGGIIKPK